MDTTTTIHKFEEAGLGKAPFRFVEVWMMPSKGILEANPDAYNNSIAYAWDRGIRPGSCAFCGHGITAHYILISADGKKFAVGCDCVEKTGDKGLVRRCTEEKRQQDRKKRWERQDRNRAAYKEMLETHREQLAAQPHPYESLAQKGKTLYDYYSFCGYSERMWRGLKADCQVAK